MPPFIRTARKLTTVLPILLIVGATAITPVAVLANNQGPGGGQNGDSRGERPQTRYVTIKEMLRMNESELRTFGQYHLPSKLSGGVMGRYNLRFIARAIASKRGMTARLIERVENVQTRAERWEIVSGLLRVHEARSKQAYEALREQYLKILSPVHEHEDDFDLVFREVISNPGQFHPNKKIQAFYDAAFDYNHHRVYIELLSHMKEVDYWRK